MQSHSEIAMKFYFVLVLLILTYSCGKDSDGGAADSSATITPEIKTMTEEFMDLVNYHRTSIGLRPLIHDESMGEIARKHSENMAKGLVAFGHDGFSGRCSEAKSAMGGGNYCAENVAMGQKSAQAAFNSWMSSSGHKANIEGARSTHTGFGFAKNSSGRYYWTQIFLEVD